MTHVEVLHAVPRVVPWVVPVAFALPSSCRELWASPPLTWLFCFQKWTNPAKQSSDFFFSFLFFAGISGSWDQTPLLTGGPSRRAAVTTAPAPGPEGNTLLVASLSWQILKTWLFVFDCFCSLFMHHFAVINKRRFLKRLCSDECTNMFTTTLWMFVFFFNWSVFHQPLQW